MTPSALAPRHADDSCVGDHTIHNQPTSVAFAANDLCDCVTLTLDLVSCKCYHTSLVTWSVFRGRMKAVAGRGAVTKRVGFSYEYLLTLFVQKKTPTFVFLHNS